MPIRRRTEVLAALAVLLLAQPAPAAEVPETLGAIVRDFEEDAAGWNRVAAFLARYGKWPDAARAQAKALAHDRGPGSRLLLARYQLHARDLAGAGESLESLEASRASRWLRIELALARGDVDAAERGLQELAGLEAGPDDDAIANILYCGQSLHAADVDDALRARVALAREDAQAALLLARKIGGRARYPDARVLASKALEQLGEPGKAIDELEALHSNPIPPQTHCPGVLRDRVLFNQANIAARSRDRERSPADLYETAIKFAAERERSFNDAVTLADVPLASPLNQVLLPARHNPFTAAPEARNNLGHYLLRTALREKEEIARGAMLVRAQEAFAAAAANPEYATRQYAYAGLASVKLAAGVPEEALEPVAQALALDPQNQEALGVAAALASNEEAALLLVSAAREALPPDYAHEEFDEVLRPVIEKAKSGRGETSAALLASVDLWNGNLDSARERIASAKKNYGSSIWPAAFEGELAEATGGPADAAPLLAAVAESVQRKRLTRPWEVAAVRPSAATYNLLAVDSADTAHVVSAQTLTAAVTPAGRGSFPWQERGRGVIGRITDGQGALPGVLVTVVGADGFHGTAVTGAAGEYHIDAPPGTYVVTAELGGFQSVRTRTIVTAGGAATANLAIMQPSFVSETITVTAEATLIDPNAGTTLSETFNRRTLIQSLGNAQVVRTAVGGQSNAENRYQVDGINTTSPVGRAFSSFTLPGYLEQVTSTIAGSPAETAQPAVNVISRSGTNDVTGDLSAELQPAALRSNAEPVSVPTALHARRNESNVQVSVGGPLVRDRFWLYLLGDLRSVAGSPDEERVAGRGSSRATELFAKFNLSLTSRWHTVFSLDKSRETQSGVVDDVAGAAFGDSQSIRRRGERDLTTAMGSISGVLGADYLAELRGNWQQADRSLRPLAGETDAMQRRDVVNAFFTRDGVGFIDDGRRTGRTNVMGLLTFASSNVRVRIGGAHDGFQDRVRDRLSGGGMRDVIPRDGPLGFTVIPRRWLFNGAVVDESGDSGATAAHVHQQLELGRVVVDAGVRWERQALRFPSGHEAATEVLQPRLGVMVDPFADGRIRLSASFARYADPLTADELLAFGSQRLYAAAEEVYGGLEAIDPGLRGRFTDELSASAGRQFKSTGGIVQIRAVNRRLHSQIEDYFCTPELNRCVGNPGRGLMGGPPARREVTFVETMAWDESDLEVGGNDIKTNWRLTYTWSRGSGNVEPPDVTSTRVVGIDPYARTAFDVPSLILPDQPLARDRRHTIVASAVLQFDQPYADGPFALGLWARWRSGEPLGRFGYSDPYGRYVTFLRPRGSEGRTPNVLESDVSLTYTRPVGHSSWQFGVAVSNALDQQTMLIADQRWSFVEARNGSASPQNPNYLEPMVRLAPRSARLFAKFMF